MKLSYTTPDVDVVEVNNTDLLSTSDEKLWSPWV